MSRKKTGKARLDLVVFAAHPDDAELVAGGSIAKAVRRGWRVGIVDATRGEAGTRGSARIRAQEAARAAKILGIHTRVNLGLPDGYLEADETTRRTVVTTIRALRPRVIVAPYWESRHPDHRALSLVVRDACFLSGLRRWKADGAPWSPERVLLALAFQSARPRFLVDISAEFDVKERALRAHASQTRNVDRLGDVTPSARGLFETIRIIHGYYGWLIGVPFAEPFLEVGEMASDGLDSWIAE